LAVLEIYTVGINGHQTLRLEEQRLFNSIIVTTLIIFHKTVDLKGHLWMVGDTAPHLDDDTNKYNGY
jgi:hypothetical protein